MLIPGEAGLPPTQTFGEPPVDVSPLYVPSEDYRTLALAQNERVRPRDGLVIPCIEVTFVVPGLPGVFTINIDNYAFVHVDVTEYMRERAHLIRGLYALPGHIPAYVPPATSTEVVIADLQAAAEAAALATIPGALP